MDRNVDAVNERRIGELARSTGLSVRTLHYYEEIGLLVASDRNDAGHRLYDDGDITRLYRIVLLRRLGLPLAEIHKALDDPEWSLATAVETHLQALEKRLDGERRLRGRLAHLLASLGDRHAGLTEDLLPILEDMIMLDTNVQRRISTLVYSDIGAATTYLERVFGFGPAQLTRNGEGLVVHAEIQAGDGLVWLHPESAEFQLASPRSLGASTAMVSVLVDDVDAHFEHAQGEGADVLYRPVDQSYGYREYSARDLEGHLWSFMRSLD